jgi:hypothetical protein
VSLPVAYESAHTAEFDLAKYINIFNVTFLCALVTLTRIFKCLRKRKKTKHFKIARIY